MSKTEPALLNGIDCPKLKQLIADVAGDPSKGRAKFRVTTEWKGGVQSESRVDVFEVGGKALPRRFTIRIDEPPEFLGTNTGPNPQEVLMAAFNACLLAGYVTGCALHEILLHELSIETEGDLDLRGYLGLEASVRPGYDEIGYCVRIRGDGTPEQFQAIHEMVLATSPNRWNLGNAVRLKSSLVVE